MFLDCRYCLVLISAVLLLVDGQQIPFGVLQVVDFSNKMIPHLLQGLSHDRDNVVYSPFGLSSAIAMAMEGVDSKMAADIATTLRLERPTVAKQILRLGFKALLEEFEAKQNEEDTAGSYNRAHLHSSVPLLPEYKAVLENFYKANLSHNVTENSSDLVLELRTDTGVMSHWKDFDKLAVYTYLTHQPAAEFMTHTGQVVSTPMIPQVGVFRAGYLPRLNSQAVELPLEGDTASLVLIMPDYRDGISEVLVKMLKEKIADIAKSLPRTEAEVSLPQFAMVSTDLDVGKVLRKSGLKQLFSTGKSKSKRGPVKSIKQNAYFATSFVSVNSVSATNTVLAKKLPAKKTKREAVLNKFAFNKPFLFFVFHQPSGLVLLAGLVKTPSQVPK
ncbi:leukocyte elastase inhibitor-like isoform X2 [Rhodnius prolixus]|uniref:leukocyte elastase inhibitor-like isoform X2 n=1 Tax=Rhodnius prolixus TaxID=13249 RepID=UPI003D18C0D6